MTDFIIKAENSAGKRTFHGYPLAIIIGLWLITSLSVAFYSDTKITVYEDEGRTYLHENFTPTEDLENAGLIHKMWWWWYMEMENGTNSAGNVAITTIITLVLFAFASVMGASIITQSQNSRQMAVGWVIVIIPLLITLSKAEFWIWVTDSNYKELPKLLFFSFS